MNLPNAGREAAVIVPVYRTPEGELRVILVRRSPEGVHGGQIAFPGGMREPSDQTPLETALRELTEELSIIRGDIEVLEELPVMETLTTGYLVSPFLARLLKPRQWVPCEREIVEVV